MKRIFIAMACMTVIVYGLSCSKSDSSGSTGSCSGPSAVSDSTILLAYAKTYNITPMADTSWLYYQVINPGTGATPSASSTVYVRYGARLMDGTYFDSSGTDVKFELDNLIKGWQYGLPKIKVGGQIKLLIPSALGYGCYGAGGAVPPNSPLYFNIYLDSLQ